MLKTILRKIAFKTGRLHGLYVRYCDPDGDEYARYLKARGTFHSQGDACYIMPTTKFTDPEYVEIGSNVQFGSCIVLGHDGSIAMLNRAYDVVLDAVGPVRFKDNVFIGQGVTVMPNVTIGPNAIVGAGSVVVRDVPEGKIVSGVPAKVIGSVEALVAYRAQRTNELPWAHLLHARGSAGFDPALEPELRAQRLAHFFGADEAAQQADGTQANAASDEKQPPGQRLVPSEDAA